MSLLQISVYIPAAVAAIRLWDNVLWLAILVAIAGVTYGIHGDEHAHYAAKGEHSDTTATRLGLTALMVWGIFVYSLFI